MRTILKIGYHKFLFPDEGKATKALALLAGAMQVDHDFTGQDKDYKAVSEDDHSHCNLSVECLPAKTKILRPDGAELKATAKPPRGSTKALPAPRFLALK